MDSQDEQHRRKVLDNSYLQQQQQNQVLSTRRRYETQMLSDEEDPFNTDDIESYTDSSCGYSSPEDRGQSPSPPPRRLSRSSRLNQKKLLSPPPIPPSRQREQSTTRAAEKAGIPTKPDMNDSTGIPVTTVTHTNNNSYEVISTNNQNNVITTNTTDNIGNSITNNNNEDNNQCIPDLPPRPIQAIPQLPPRPSNSTLARAKTIVASSRKSRTNRYRVSSPPTGYLTTNTGTEESSLRRSNTAANTMHRNGLSKTDALPVCPNFSHASRKPPLVLNEKPMIATGHNKSSYALAALGNRFFTGHYFLRIWDVYSGNHINTLGDVNNQTEVDKIRAILPAPCPDPAEEGRYVWVAKQDSYIYIVDTIQPTFNKKLEGHAAPVIFLLRFRNTEVWSIDELGILNIWNLKQMTATRYGVTQKDAVAATIQGRKLWMSNGRTLAMYNISSNNEPDIPSIRIPNELGNITSLITIPFHPDCVFSSHEYGKITKWDAKTMKKLQVITVSMYGICTMVTVGERYVWAGYSTGMIYVYDTRPENWAVVKSWKAHSSAVLHMVVDHSGFVLDNGKAQVFSGDSAGYVGVWDGLLTDYWKERNLLKRQSEFCKYRENNIMICSWNIDANKPEKLIDENDQVREWLRGMDNPNIIVVGIQEIIDLESKKQTAKSFFAGRKKGDTVEAEEGLTKRYKLWRDYLVDCVKENFGENHYYVAKTEQLVGLFSCIFVRVKDKERIFGIDSTSVKTGLKVMNKSIHGNKGGIAIRMTYDDSSLCFVNCHLAAGQSHVKQRNADVEGILHSAIFPYLDKQVDKFSHGGDGTMILDHEFCFLSGDLNYRVDSDRRTVIDKLIILDKYEKEDARKELQEKDQLLRQRITNPLFKLLMFHEAPIEFDPTYKYNPGTDVYDQSEKLRVPAWCDRILYKGNHIESLYYRRYEVRASDHRPISSGLRFKTKIMDREKRQVLSLEIEKDWQEYILHFTKERKTRYLADYEKCSKDDASSILEKANWNVRAAIVELSK